MRTPTNFRIQLMELINGFARNKPEDWNNLTGPVTELALTYFTPDQFLADFVKSQIEIGIKASSEAKVEENTFFKYDRLIKLGDRLVVHMGGATVPDFNAYYAVQKQNNIDQNNAFQLVDRMWRRANRAAKGKPPGITIRELFNEDGSLKR